MLFLTEAEIDEQIRQLCLPDGDENTENPDTQYSDYPVKLTIPSTMNSYDAGYWLARTQEIYPGEDIEIQIGE